MRLKDKVVLLTGASGGIGKQVALLFAKEGARVVAADIRKEKLEGLLKESTDLKGEISTVEADLSKDEDIKKMVDHTLEKFKKIDILVNNAGVLDNFTPLGDLDDELWDWVLKINLTAPMKLMREVLPKMLDQGSGNIINVASLGGIYGGRAGTAYTASKYGLIGITKNTAYMYGEKGIRCNAICPGGVESDIMDNFKPNEFGMERIMKGAKNDIRSGSGKEIANIALFLASDESSFVNGDQIVADAGWTAY